LKIYSVSLFTEAPQDFLGLDGDLTRKRLTPRFGICSRKYVKADRFVVLYDYPPRIEYHSSSLEIYGVSLFGGKMVFGNNYTPAFTTLHG